MTKFKKTALCSDSLDKYSQFFDVFYNRWTKHIYLCKYMCNVDHINY